MRANQASLSPWQDRQILPLKGSPIRWRAYHGWEYTNGGLGQLQLKGDFVPPPPTYLVTFDDGFASGLARRV
jgi:hypothetical protein